MTSFSLEFQTVDSGRGDVGRLDHQGAVVAGADSGRDVPALVLAP